MANLIEKDELLIYQLFGTDNASAKRVITALNLAGGGGSGLLANGSVTGATATSQPFTIGVTTPLIRNGRDVNITAGENVGTSSDSFSFVATLTGSIIAGTDLSLEATVGELSINSGGGIFATSTGANVDGYYISIHTDATVAIGDTNDDQSGEKIIVDVANSVIKFDNNAHTVDLEINGLTGASGTGTVITQMTVTNGIITSITIA